jgi:hypothetical protein
MKQALSVAERRENTRLADEKALTTLTTTRQTADGVSRAKG